MCGIAGIVDRGAGFGADQLKEIAVAMRDTMTHRGPDDYGVWVNPSGRVALAHRRLSIIDVRPAGHQPMGTADGQVHVTFNGEVYNYKTIRKQLEADGFRFKSLTDTETIPYLYQKKGANAIGNLDGMFGLGIWDETNSKLLLARDRHGKKPVYYASGDGWFAFASELQALRKVPGFDRTIDRDALGYYFLLQYVPAPLTIYRSARKVPPGSTLELDCRCGTSEPSVKEFWRFEVQQPHNSVMHSDADDIQKVKELVIGAVEQRLMSDVPLGAFLSGGVDSSLIVAVIRKELGLNVSTFSVGFEGVGNSEHVFARKTAEYLGTDHYDQVIDTKGLLSVDQIAALLDEPNGDASCLPTYLLCRHARQYVTVAISGDGGDEMFGGYGRYRDTLIEAGNWLARLEWSTRNCKWWTPADGYLSPRWFVFQPPVVRRLLGGLSPRVEESLASWRNILNDSTRPLIHRMRSLDAMTYMPGAVLAKVDRMSMQNSLEVRCPLLDTKLAEYVSNLRASSCWRAPDKTKWILKELASQYLPQEWMQRPKMGFGPPSHAWPARQMLDLAENALTSPESQLDSLVDSSELKTIIDEQRKPGHFSIYRTWPLLILEFWLRHTSLESRIRN